MRRYGIDPNQAEHPRPSGYNGNTCRCVECFELRRLYDQPAAPEPEPKPVVCEPGGT